MELATQPYALRRITTAVAASESEAPTFTVLDGVAQWNKQQVSPIPGFNAYPYARVRVSGTGTAGDRLDIRGRLASGAVITLGRVTAGTGGVFPDVTDLNEKVAAAWGVRVVLSGATALNNVTVYIEGYQDPPN